MFPSILKKGSSLELLVQTVREIYFNESCLDLIPSDKGYVQVLGRIFEVLESMLLMYHKEVISIGISDYSFRCGANRNVSIFRDDEKTEERASRLGI